ncbi:MAG: hypothetical protein C0624_00925 [Desulfuromonas sp.]|nr:MAG: hypothetical protein C0624_00925 [Desulfuromonas sp.]
MKRILLITCLCLFATFAYAEHSGSPPETPASCLSPTATLTPREIEHRVLDEIPTDSVSLHRLNYAILGDRDAKMQFSFKFRLAKELPLYFAYSNMALWDIYETSSPFNDINFMPEFFYRFHGNNSWLISTDAGYIHTSNGKDGDLSRSWDRVALRINTAFTPGPMHLIWITALYAPLTTGGENKDIEDYLGYWETYCYLRGLLGSRSENLDLEFALHSGRNSTPFDRGNMTIGLKYRLPTDNFTPYLYAQYFYGYGETLLSYNDKESKFRAGLAFFY